MSKKTLSELYEENLLSEPQQEELIKIALQRNQRHVFKNLMRREKKIIYLRWALWTSLVLGIGTVAVWKRSKSEPKPPTEMIYASVTPQTMFQNIAAPSAPDDKQMGNHSVKVEDVVKPFVEFYHVQNYKNCVALAPDINQLQHLTIPLAYCHLQLGEYARSIAILEKYHANPNVPHDESRWWLGLAHGLAGNAQLMKKYLGEIKPNQYRYQEAQQLMN